MAFRDDLFREHTIQRNVEKEGVRSIIRKRDHSRCKYHSSNSRLDTVWGETSCGKVRWSSTTISHFLSSNILKTWQDCYASTHACLWCASIRSGKYVYTKNSTLMLPLIDRNASGNGLTDFFVMWGIEQNQFNVGQQLLSTCVVIWEARIPFLFQEM